MAGAVGKRAGKSRHRIESEIEKREKKGHGWMGKIAQNIWSGKPLSRSVPPVGWRAI